MSAASVAVNSLSPSSPAGDAAYSVRLLEISNDTVRLFKKAFGRGPTKARTLFAGPNTVVVMLEDGFTAAERTLLSMGEIERLREARLTVQQALEDPARSLVEDTLGRKTLAFITGIDLQRDVVMNVFTLAPAAVGDHHQDSSSVDAVDR